MKRETEVAGISLAGRRVVTMRPTDTMKARFWKLKRGMGYPVKALAEQWGLSVETVKRHAREQKALRWVEQAPGDWVDVVVHPGTKEETEV